ncbi:ABC transporter ATP-binding protein [Coxiella burnetii]|uniref:Glycine betaine transport ATP-binding protein n=2 Tax=Coxiella burnetii TaxID=777 RepID=Q83EY0_COXBU|nr:ATP-binding cassette domain-containing protein [Coxiella burnetii]NP_819224.1 glycine betaine ABC transporter ATP-binding protein [Coxiella burnetii RSA 493]AAO89738.1 glycine betaine transport ATP-binding protein [Coxiella burnetii RSA 493]ABS76960.1 glycine betaine transport ATP-binding protein [Coxiella burnetii Dugway 5J108-111]ABX78734.1 ABC transporter, quaternary amine uptake transporter (QAT) family, ATP-binding protein [Coxiella burnetii RSA 331]ACJ19091.1 glycine betaine transport
MITLDRITKFYRSVKSPAVDSVSFEVKDGETLVLLGSSGSGKTTLMKMINRLIEPTSGTIKIEGKDVREYNLSELRRSIGYVFQQIGLFPHMTIEKNITILLKLLHYPKAKRIQRAAELLEMVHLDPQKFAQRYSDELSGGQQQRVGVARALAADPKYLLMDEPFGALDAMTRSALQEEMIHLNQKLGKTIVFVTHDIFEAFRIADRIAVMHKGKLEQIGTKNELLNNPATEFVEQLVKQPAQQIEDLEKNR